MWPAIFALLLHGAAGEILTPPYLNLALGKKITATATCGDIGQELYCELTGSTDETVIQGQVCEYCDDTVENRRHPPEYAVDGLETRWQSPPLSRGMKYNEVNLTIDLGQEFHVAYVFIKMGNSPRPGLWALEKSTDYGKTFTPWQYFSDSRQDCERYFGAQSLEPITRDDSVICSTEYSKIVPLSGGEIPISLLNYRPSALNYFNSSVLQAWTRATTVRLRLLRTKNLLGHLMSVARQDPTVTRRYFYSIKDISIGGRCMCNGHADTCDPKPDSENLLVCRCQHNTCGPQCNQCCKGFEQKKWRISQNWNRFACEPCNCHNHSTECVFDSLIDEQRLSLDIHGRYEGGGVCQNCQHNTDGINCNKCKPTFYRPVGKRWDEYDVCQPCNCDLHYSTGNCEEGSGRCECRKEYNPPNCDSCAYGYFNYPNCEPCTCNLNGTEGQHCTPVEGICPCKSNYAGKSCEICADGFYSPECKDCECNTIGSVSQVCDKDSGNCTCKSKFSGRTCDRCEAGYFSYPTCSQCNCDTTGTQSRICDDVSGACICKEGFGGARCDQCLAGYYMQVQGRERACVQCECSTTGSTSTSCAADGKCNCLTNFGGKRCDQCSPGYYKYPECLPCNCDGSGSIGSSCDDAGNCHCKPNFNGIKCDSCKESFYNYPACEECNCDPKGVIASFAGCGSVPAGELCQCKERVQGRICNDCKPLYWNLQYYNPHGCEECNCDVSGTLGGLGSCNTKTGQCMCKPNVDDRQCSECADGFYNLDAGNIFGCSECNCDVGGSTDNNCNKTTGQCYCHSRVEGLRCSQPIRAHYFPTLHQFRYELEEGQTPSGAVRYRDSQEAFPGHSWKGYVMFSLLQNEVINVVQLSKSSLYRMVVKYANPLKDPVVATILVTPENPGDSQQTHNVLLRPTVKPQLVTVAGEKGNTPSPFVMDAGNWTVTIKTNKEVLIDYFVLIPEAYYEATVLKKLVDRPCTIGEQDLCREFRYPKLSSYPTVDASGLTSAASDYLDDNVQLKELGVPASTIPVLGTQSLTYNWIIKPNGQYIIVVEYVTPVDRNAVDMVGNRAKINSIINVNFKTGGQESQGRLVLNECLYTKPCRQVVTDDKARAFVAEVFDENNEITLEGNADNLAGIKSITAIPLSEWHLAYITPKPYTLRRNGETFVNGFDNANTKEVKIEPSDNSTTPAFVVAGSKPVTVDISVPTPGPYEFLLHYHQPDHPESSIDVTISCGNNIHAGRVTLPFCGSSSGCRELLKLPSEIFDVTDNCSLTFEGADSKGVSLQSVLIIEPRYFTESVLVEANMMDYTREFITKCASNHYYIEPEVTGFCRDAVFSITAEYNSGTLSCACDVEGSTDFECETFGGQCTCRENVVGRTCEACKTGYYGFPNCRPCHCSQAAICDDNGQCICPRNVIGENCNECRPLTFNFDEYRGCDDCNCNPLGVVDGNLECDKQSGNCQCKENVVGRVCDRCVPGHYAFPDCVQCSCNTDGTTEDVCDQDTAQCYCKKYVRSQCSCNTDGTTEDVCDQDTAQCYYKENVVGRVCDRCVPGHYAFPDCVQCSCNTDGTTEDVCDQDTAQCYCKKYVRSQACDVCQEEYFNLQASNPDGCTKCYCFGRTTRCSSSYLTWVKLEGMTGWHLVNVETNRTISVYPHTAPPSQVNDTIIGVELAIDKDHQKLVYFAAPEHFIGKRLTSYGGNLTYSIFYVSRETGKAILAADVIIGGPNGYIYHNSIETPAPQTNWIHSVPLTEESFTNLDNTAVTRDQFMNTLVNVTAIYIRATFEDESVTTRLINVTLDVAVQPDPYSPITDRAFSVEQCQCPPGYKGTSCEQCASGHYRLSSGPHAGYCVPCECNGHSQECDVNTGVCLDCGGNSMGDHCEMCVPGYYGDATREDCEICACPLPYPSNNFAVSCDLSDNAELISCQCKPGYGGPRCEFCAAGYYGEPEELNDYCKPCNCSGNINPLDPSSCDSVTGNCLKCVNNTAGAACNLCAPGFYGDAVFSKNCTACSCDEYGMDHCDHTTGTCVCRPGVIGERCDACAPDHFGLSSGLGCMPCQCGLASESSQCDLETGQCKCAKGVTGRHCEQCAAGYWNYTKYGCDHCNCNKGYSLGFMCNAQSGQCECLPGVIGEKCDRCPERWVLVPQQGCQECDSCTDALVISVEEMSARLANETQEFKDKADSFFTTQRLNYISNQASTLRPRLAELRSVDLNAATSAVDSIENAGRGLLRSAEFAATDSEKQITRAGVLSSDADIVLTSIRDSARAADATVQHVADLATGLELSQQPKVDSALTEAQQIRDDVKEKDLTPKRTQALDVHTNATQQLERMSLFVQPVNQQATDFEKLVTEARKLRVKMEDMMEHTAAANQRADVADRLKASNKNSKFSDKVASVGNLNSEAMKDLIDAGADIANATRLNNLAAAIVTNASAALESLNEENNKLEQALKERGEEIPSLYHASDAARSHADDLKSRAKNLHALAERENDTRRQHAYSAASAYSSIVQEIGAARKAADEATEADTKTNSINTNLNEKVGPALNRSSSLRDQAIQALGIVNNALAPNQTKAELALQQVKKTIEECDDRNSAIVLSLPAITKRSLQDEMDKAEKVNQTVKSTLKQMSDLGNDLNSSKQSAQTLPKKADEALKMKDNVETLVNNIDGLKPKLQQKYDGVRTQQEDFERRKVEAAKKLSKIKEQIEQARTVANRVQVGVNFDRFATLQPRIPDTIDEMSTSTHVSAYFKTRSPDGFLFYLGNPEGTSLRRTKSDDFMAVSIQNGYPYLVIDIGDSAESGREPMRINSDKRVDDDKWYQVIVDRVGGNVKFTIREALEDGTEQSHSKEVILPGQHTIFNLDRQKSKLYVGGVPSNSKLQGVSYPAFEGQIEELMLGDTPVGLWNFEAAQKLKGARQRDKLITSQSGPQEYRFNGRAHVTMPVQSHDPQKNHVLLFFRTYARNGLIFLAGDDRNFFSIQMQDGKVYLQVSLGNPEELVIVGTTKEYNDGKWHKLDARRHLKSCWLSVDNESSQMVSPSTQSEIYAVDSMNFGGDNKGIIQITDQGFDGCMRQISVNEASVDLSKNSVESIGVGDGCKFASLVSLSGGDSTLRYMNISTENLQLTLKFKTDQPDGLIFVYISRTQTPTMQDSLTLSLTNGKLVLMSPRDTLDTSQTYNDSQWHVVTVSHGAALRMRVDDYDHYSSDSAPEPLNILDGVLLLGGTNSYVATYKAATKTAFRGCIADATINGRVLNLLEPASKRGATFGRCGDTISGFTSSETTWEEHRVEPSSHVLPTVPPPAPDNPFQGEVETQPPPARVEPVTRPPVTQAPAPSTLRPTTPRPAPQPQPGCALAHDRHYTIGDPTEGYRFGTREDSRIEYAKLPGRQSDELDLMVTLRTFDKHGGIIFYATTERAPDQFLAIYMKDAQIHFTFNCGGDTATIVSPDTYSGTDWHTVTVSRTSGHGKLTVDNQMVGEASVSCDNPVPLAAPYYYGGLKSAEIAKTHLEDFYQPFKGCLKGLIMNGQYVTEVLRRVNALRCTDNIEDGIYFGPSTNTTSNYLKLQESNFRVGISLSISMEIKPRNTTGLLLAVHGKKDYLVLELLEHEVVVNVENGKGEFHASYKLAEPTSLCDGNWHKIQVAKARHVVSVGVDNHFGDAGLGTGPSTDTRSALYIGGHEKAVARVRGVRSKRGFTGCIRNIQIREQPISIPLSAAHRDTHVGACPVD
ncbi:laminin subunit alpha [Cydia fagiglandana]|uniref:laminin subunit alpha n=1 Tax=Cydia fagiglandana TaxID=1458189 RepID=UPI002FEE44E2